MITHHWDRSRPPDLILAAATDDADDDDYDDDISLVAPITKVMAASCDICTINCFLKSVKCEA